MVHLQALIDAYRQWLLGRSYVVKHVGGGYELTQWDHSSGLVKEAPVDYWRCLVRARAVHWTSTVPADDAPPATAPSRVHAMLASSKKISRRVPPRRAPRLRRRSWRAVDARIARRRRQLRRRRPARRLALAAARAPAFPGDPRALSSTAPPARAARPASAGPPRRRVGALRERYTPPPRASAVHNQMLREYERAYGVAPLSVEALRAARGRR